MAYSEHRVAPFLSWLNGDSILFDKSNSVSSDAPTTPFGLALHPFSAIRTWEAQRAHYTLTWAVAKETGLPYSPIMSLIFQHNQPMHNRGCNNLSAMAVEILFEIASYLADDPPQLTALMLTCRGLTGVCEHIRYSTVVIQGLVGRRLLSMFLSGTSTSHRYCETVTSLWFRGVEGEDTYWMYHLFSISLVLLRNLQTLWIEEGCHNGDQLFKSLTRASLIRQQHHPALSFKPLWAKDCGDSSPMHLPNLLHLRVEDAQVWPIASYRPLTELQLDFTLNVEVFAGLLGSAEGSVLGRALRKLFVKLSRTIAVGMALPMISNAFPSLVLMQLDSPGSEAKDVLGHFGVPSPIFPNLECLVCNAFRFQPAPRSASPDPALVEEVQRFLPGILRNHLRLRCVEVGAHMWGIDKYGQFCRVHTVDLGRRVQSHFGDRFSRGRFFRGANL